MRAIPQIFLLLWLGLGLMSFAAPPLCYSQTDNVPGQEQLPLNITAARLEVDHSQQVISFLTKVEARYKDLILYTDLLKIFYQAKTETPGGKTSAGQKDDSKGAASPLGAVGIEKILRIEALGNVRIVQQDRVATGEKAIYYTQEEKIVLLGNPQLWRGESSLKGREIVFFLKDNRAVVEGDPEKRVEAVIYPSSKFQVPGKSAAKTP
ncbi:LptA/OstA family protein [Desulfobacca acetoxidans]